MSLPKLSDITKATNTVLEWVVESGGEMTPELQELFEFNELQLQDKADAYKHVMDALSERELTFKMRAKEYTEAARTITNAIQRIKYRIKFVMMQNELKEISGSEFTFKLGNAAPVMKIDEEKLSSEYFKEVTEKVLDKEKIKEDLKLGVPVEGVTMKSNTALRITIAKGE